MTGPILNQSLVARPRAQASCRLDEIVALRLQHLTWMFVERGVRQMTDQARQQLESLDIYGQPHPVMRLRLFQTFRRLAFVKERL